MGFLRALGRAGYGAGRTSRWRFGSAQLTFTDDRPSERYVNMRVLKGVEMPVGVRGIFYNAVSSGKAGKFSGGKFAAGTTDTEAGSEPDDEDADPDADLEPGALSLDQAMPFNKLYTMFMENSSRDPGNMIKEWQEEGNTFSREVFIKLFRKLRARKRDGQAHRFIQWVLRTQPIKITSKVYQFAIMAAQKVKKLHIARRIYDQLPAELKTPALCTSMVTACASKNEAEQAETVMASFKAVTAQSYNTLMLMYLRMNQTEKAVDVFDRMRKAGVKPSDLTFYILAKYNRRLGIQINKTEADMILNECLEGLDVKRDRVNAASNVLLAYAHMGDLKGAKKAWSYVEQMDNIVASGHAAGIEAFGLLGDLDKVKLIAKQVQEGKRRDKAFYPALIGAYALNGRMDKAVGIVDDLKSKEGVPVFSECYDELICGYIARNEPEMAIEKAKEFLEVIPEKRSKPSFMTLKKMLAIYKQFKDVQGAEDLFMRYKGWRDAPIFNDLLKVYAEAGKPAPGFENRMRLKKVKPDEETKKLLEIVNQFTPPAAAATA